MHFRKLAVAAAVTSAILAQGVSALGLGEVKLNSTLNEPLDAEIKLLQVRDLSEQEILVGLAADSDFKRASVDKIFFLNGIKFEIDLKPVTGPVVKLSSSKPVTEPYLNFLLETRWPTGRLLREYTLLMDLPVFTEEAKIPVQAARRREPAVPHNNQIRDQRQNQAKFNEQTDIATTPADQPAQPQADSSASVSNSVQNFGPVGADDTMWAIALKVRPNRGVSVQQTMLAIQRLNPDAFINGNINLLKRGKVLRVPTAAEIEQLNARQAISAVADQNTAWSGNSSGRLSGAPLDASSSENYNQVENSQPAGRIKLAGSSSSAVAGDGRGGSAAQGAELQQALEQLDKSKRDNQELSSRVQDLEAQIQTMERLVSVTSEQLSALQQSVADSKIVMESQGAGIEDAAMASADDNTTVNSSVAENAAEDVGVAGNAAADLNANDVAKLEAKPKPANAVAVVSAAKPEPGFVDLIMANMVWIGGGLLAILLAVWALLRRGGKKEDEEEFDQGELEVGLGLDDVVNDVAEDDLDTLADVEADSNDTVSEADVYIAYGKFDKAEGILNGILDADPSNVDARLKLMEVFAETGNGEGFEQQYQQVLNDGSEQEVQRAEQLRDAFGLSLPAEDSLAAFELEDEQPVSAGLESNEGQVGAVTSTNDALDALAFDIGFEEERDEEFEAAITDSDKALAGEEELYIPEQEPQEVAEFSFDVDESSSDSVELEVPALALAETDLEQSEVADDLVEEVSYAAKAEENFIFDIEAEDPVEALGGVALAANAESDVELELAGEQVVAEVDAEEQGLVEANDSDASVELGIDFGEPEPDSSPIGQNLDDSVDTELNDGFANADLDNAAKASSSIDGEDFDFSAPLDTDFDLDEDFDMAALDKELDTDLSLDTDAVISSGDDSDLDELETNMPALDLADSSDEHVAEAGTAGVDLAADDDDFDAELDFLSDSDEVATKLDLARAYMDMGDKEGAKEILQEVVAEGDDQQKQDAEALVERMG